MMKVSASIEKDGQTNLFGATFSQTTISGISVAMATVDGILLLSLADLSRALAYKNGSPNIRRACARNGADFDAHLVLLNPPTRVNTGHPKILFVNQYGLISLCNVLPPERTAELRKWMATQGLNTVLERSNQSCVVFSALIGECRVRVAIADGNPFLAVRDASQLIGYSKEYGNTPLQRIFDSEGDDINNYIIVLMFGGRIPPAFINISGLEKMCALIRPTKRTSVVRQWLDQYREWAGGTESLIASMRGTDIREAREVVLSNRTGRQKMQPPSSGKTTAIRRTVPAAAPPPQPPLVTQPDPEHTHQRDYSAQLASVIAKHATAEELAGLVRTLEGLKSDILARRYAPDLNSAVYELFARFNLASPTGSAVTQAGTGAGT